MDEPSRYSPSTRHWTIKRRGHASDVGRRVSRETKGRRDETISEQRWKYPSRSRGEMIRGLLGLSTDVETSFLSRVWARTGLRCREEGTEKSLL